MTTRLQPSRAAFTIFQMLVAPVVVGIIAAVLTCFFDSRREALLRAEGRWAMRNLAEEQLQTLIGQDDIRNKLIESTRRVADEYPNLRFLSVYADTLEGK